MAGDIKVMTIRLRKKLPHVPPLIIYRITKLLPEYEFGDLLMQINTSMKNPDDIYDWVGVCVHCGRAPDLPKWSDHLALSGECTAKRVHGL